MSLNILRFLKIFISNNGNFQHHIYFVSFDLVILYIMDHENQESVEFLAAFLTFFNIEQKIARLCYL